MYKLEVREKHAAQAAYERERVELTANAHKICKTNAGGRDSHNVSCCTDGRVKETGERETLAKATQSASESKREAGETSNGGSLQLTHAALSKGRGVVG